jgi:uncharacterized protein YdaU (DUF1376 family)
MKRGQRLEYFLEKTCGNMGNNSTKQPVDEGLINAEIERFNPPPAFQFYPKDWLAHPLLAALNHEEFGFLIRLICFLWLQENLFFDEKILARLMHVTPKKFKILFAPMKNFFEIQDGFIRCPQLEAERQKQANWRLKSAIGGQKSAEARRKGGSILVDTVVQPNGNPSSSSSSSSSSPTAKLSSKRRQQRGDAPSSSSDSPKSKFSFEEIKEYVLACQANGQGIRSVGGMANKLHQTGNSDFEINEFQANGKTLSDNGGNKDLVEDDDEALKRVGARPAN